MTTTYDIGDRRKLCCEIRNESGDLADPTGLTFKIYEPDKVVTTFVYGTDNELVKDSVGNYHVYWDITLAGIHWWRYEATGTIGVAEETSFKVRKSNIPVPVSGP